MVTTGSAMNVNEFVQEIGNSITKQISDAYDAKIEETINEMADKFRKKMYQEKSKFVIQIIGDIFSSQSTINKELILKIPMDGLVKDL